jgi:malate dehydrogenase
MRDVAIIGAGELGGNLAHRLAARQIDGAIRLIEEVGRVAEGKALDIMQAAPVEGFAARVSGSTDLSAAGGAAIIAIADRWRGAEWQGEEAVQLLQRLNALAPRALIVCAGANQRDLVESAASDLHLARTRSVGSAAEAMTAAVRAIIALECDASPQDVAVSVVGVPPAHTVVAWEDAAVGGFALARVLDEPARRRVGQRVAGLWPPGPHALAAAATAVIERMLGRSRHVVSCFVAPEGTGRRVRAAALPVRLGESGVEEVLMPPLSAAERTAFENATSL